MTDLKVMLGLDVEVPQIKLRQLDQLVPYYRNSRTHSPAQIELLQRLMLEFGFTNSVLVDDMGIIAGHGRCMALEELYKRGEQVTFPGGQPIPIGMVPTLDVSGWSAQQRRAYIIADNQSALQAGWDEEVLRIELKELQAADYDLHLTGFDDNQLDLLLADIVEAPPPSDPDAAPPEPEVPRSVPGDVWICGPHRVMCGDSTSIDDWDRLMNGQRADVCWIDPPYNVDLGRKNKLMGGAIGGNRSKTGAIANDKMADEDFAELIRGIYACLFAQLKPGSPIYVAHSDAKAGLFRQLFEDAGFHFSQMLIWKKNTHVLGMADFQPIHEPVLYGWKKGSKHRWYGGRKNTTVMEVGAGGPITQLEDGRWAIRVGDQVLIVSGDAQLEEQPSAMFHVPKPEKSGLHASQKPVELIERMLKNSGRAGDLVIDGCGGSGSTLIAADRLGMSSCLMELNPAFADVIVQRWQDYTGRQAVHAETGEPFSLDAQPAPEAPSVVAAIMGGEMPDLF